MRGRLLALCLCLTAGTAAAQAVVTGTVVDAGTGAPLPGAHVFVTASLRGTITDDAGRYRLTGLSPGALEVAASMVGYAPASLRLRLPPDTVLTVDFRLRARVLTLDGIEVTAERPRDWEKTLKRFLRAFLGETANAGRCTLLNPEVLTFTPAGDGFTARAEAPLLIENRALGYRLVYHLAEFAAGKERQQYRGLPRFEPLTPRNGRERRRWKKARRRAYEGSLRHFLAVLATARDPRALERAGFEAWLSPEYRADPPRHRMLVPGAILRPGPHPGTRLLDLPEVLWVRYRFEGEDTAYRADPLGYQLSWVVLNRRPAVLDARGRLEDPYALITYGYWAFERIAELLPLEYVPPEEDD